MGVSVILAITLILGDGQCSCSSIFSTPHRRHGECCGQPVNFAKIDILLGLGGYQAFGKTFPFPGFDNAFSKRVSINACCVR